MKFLISFGESNKVIEILEEMNFNSFKERIKLKFKIEDEVSVQRYDEEWEEYVDLEETPMANCRLKLIQVNNLEQVFNDISLTTNNDNNEEMESQNETASDITSNSQDR